MVNSTNNAKSSWFSRPKTGEGLQSRIRQINQFRSPETKADEILRILWVLQPLLVLYCMAIAFSSYQSFFQVNFSYEVSTLGALLLCVIIEFGKIKIGSYVFQKPFLEGWKGAKTSFAQFSVWGGALLFAGCAFFMSIQNSTTGARNLSIMEGTAKKEISFVANTGALDKQIAASNARIKKFGKIQWKGTVTRPAQRSIELEAKNLTALTNQRGAEIKTQRADFDRTRSINDKNTTTGANLLMASGGWVEALQVICMFLTAACMAVVGGVMDSEGAEQLKSQGNNIGFKPQSGSYNTANQNTTGKTQIGFNWPGYGDSAKTVTQPPDSVTQQPGQFSANGSNAVFEVCKKKVSTDLPNFSREDAKGSTVHKRISLALDECLETMSQEGFLPTRFAGAQFYSFIVEVALPGLEGRGYPYERGQEFTRKLLEVIPAEETFTV